MSDSNLTNFPKKEFLSKDNINPETVGGGNKKIKILIDSLEAFLINALKNPTKKIDTSDPLISRLAKNPRLTEDAVKELISLEKSQHFFISFRNLLRFSEEIIGFPFLKDSLRSYLKDSLCRQEIIVRLNLEGSILNIENSLPLEVCFQKIKSLSPSDLTEEYFHKVKSKDWKNYVATVALVLAEWYAKTRCMSPSQLVDLLNSTLWSNSLKKKEPEIIINNLLGSTNFELIASATTFYQQKSIDATNRLLKIENQLTDITATKNALEINLSDKDSLITKLQNDFSDLNTSYIDALAENKVEIQTLSITLKNQLEDLRVRNIRLLQSSVELLADGLIAIDRLEPKVNVMKDHAQRVFNGLNAELERLRALAK